MGSYPPRECGIGTFTYDLVNAYDAIDPSRLSTVVALNDDGQMYDYDLHDYQGRVRYQIEADDLDSFLETADALNKSRVQVVNIQHEYGLYGGEHGEYIIEFMRRLQKPVVVTMHTVLPNPDGTFKATTQAVLDEADAVVVLARAAVPLLRNNYRVSPGVHSRYSARHPGLYSQRIDSPSNQEIARIWANAPYSLPLVSSARARRSSTSSRRCRRLWNISPNVLYLVIGETHPHVRQREGEAYRNSLVELAKSLGVQRHVRFNNRFLSNNELIRYLAATDVYIMAYLNKDQIVSGTLAYAVGCGKAVVATPFTYAQEMLSDGRGIIVPFKDPAAIATGVNDLLGNRRKLLQMEERAYRFSRSMTWPNVARRYLELFRSVAPVSAPVRAASRRSVVTVA